MDLAEILDLHPVEAAPRLLGSVMVHGALSARIIEVEAYAGTEDGGSHAARGQTPRNAVMFGPSGYSYIYFNYGMHWLFNITCNRPGHPGAILVRAAVPLSGEEIMQSRRRNAANPKSWLSGPAKLCQAFGLTKEQNAQYLLDADAPLRLVAPERPYASQSSLRIGLGQGKGEHLPWRFIATEFMDWASCPPRFAP